MKKGLGIILLGLCLGSGAMAGIEDQDLLVLAGNDTAEITISARKSLGECTVKFNEIVQRLEITNRIILNTYPCTPSKNLDGKIDSYYARIYVGKF